MNFGEVVKNELLDYVLDKADNPIILSAIIHSIGSIRVDKTGLTLELATDNLRLCAYVKQMLDIHDADFRTILKKKRGRELETVIISPPTSIDLLLKSGILYELDGELALSLGIDPGQIRNDSDLRLYLAGVFLGAGAVFVPSFGKDGNSLKHGGYSMEFVLSSYDFASDLVELMNRRSCNCHVCERKDQFVVYIKESQTISDILALMGAANSVLELNNLMVLGAVRNNINRQSNCIIGNASKTADASVKQIAAIKMIDKKIGLDKLPENLRAIARERLDNPESPLNEISERLKISKSGVNHRFRRIIAIAEELSKENTEIE